jgi:RimJ/RimL family protein N-acetyltransferase
LRREDLPHRVRWLNDPEIREGLGRATWATMAEETRWWEGLRRRRDEVSFAIRDEAGVLIGNCGLRNIHRWRRTAVLGLFIGEKTHWRRGYGREALTLLLAHAFRDLGLERVTLAVRKDNVRAVGLYRAAGFRVDSEGEEDLFRDGHLHPVLRMSLRAEDFPSPSTG